MEYYFTFSSGACRKDPKRRFGLLLLQSKDEDVPLLPLPEIVTSNTDSPLHALVGSDSNSSEFLTHLMGPGPWSLRMALTVPSACGLLHFSNKNKRAPIEISHTLKLIFRVQRGDDQHMVSKTGKRKQFDIVLRMPVSILSVRPLITEKKKTIVLTSTVGRGCVFSVFVKHSTHRPPALLGEPRCSSIPTATTGGAIRLFLEWCTPTTTPSSSFLRTAASGSIRASRGRAIIGSGHVVRSQRDIRTVDHGATERGWCRATRLLCRAMTKTKSPNHDDDDEFHLLMRIPPYPRSPHLHLTYNFYADSHEMRLVLEPSSIHNHLPFQEGSSRNGTKKYCSGT